ncbi:fructose-1,6-bisphosphatase, cytosolic-like [Camellia sinensis]|uniref:fructose-1,6-bisphosphatase, cytosolic-like n=1 Tax=Camellia sinensis TaxID=4442 RepID=UPI0010368965|nr:fructose-1,6-bisphosphatase, cytosolic-like [Camellia sinensis]
MNFFLSTGNGVNGFTLDPSIGEFILTHPDIKVPKKGKIYSTNKGNAQYWDEPTTKYVENSKFPKDGSSPKSLRYIGRYTVFWHYKFLSPCQHCNLVSHLLVFVTWFPDLNIIVLNEFYRMRNFFFFFLFLFLLLFLILFFFSFFSFFFPPDHIKLVNFPHFMGLVNL